MYICSLKTNDGAVAQLVEQRTENPCVTGSIPVSTTSPETFRGFFFHKVLITLVKTFQETSLQWQIHLYECIRKMCTFAKFF